ncbi:MAG: uracil-DNA glycosylase [Gammaproteobacteria bacterium]|nr:uracil-DNA glycosylase [Gammaproteobacteria bacterium]MDH3429774.1 uracil-DNA glycosylase [Gammaproteobacteria bacterium]
MIQSEQQRRAYLEALGIDVWLPRDQPDPEEASDSSVVDAGGLDWSELRIAVAACRRCALHESRTQTVFGVGDPDSDWMIIGEAPGAEEDRRGEPFVGRAGKLLDEMLRAVGQARDSVFIANILKCRPPNNRDPKPAESSACRTYLERQIQLVQPKIILAVGRIAAQLLLDTDSPVGRLRGSAHQLGNIPLVVTYHPAYLLRSPSQKRKAWDDLCLAKRIAAGASP